MRQEPNIKQTIIGLTGEEVARRKADGLSNTAPNKITKTTWQIVRENLCTLFNLYNFIIAVGLAYVGAYAHMTYMFIIIINILIGIVQELYARHLVENLSLLGATKASALRDGFYCEVAVEELVLDDITRLEMGSQICADSEVLEGEIEVNESLLTGEADPVIKRPGGQLLSGSFVVSGQCVAKVVHVGADNFIQKLSDGARQHQKIHSELRDSMRGITKFTSWFIIPIGVLLFLQTYLSAHDIENSIITSAAALLGMLPKGMLLLISTTLVWGIIKMSRKKVLVQELYAIETLAHVDMLCLDKTGTITEGVMQVSGMYPTNPDLLPASIEETVGAFIGVMDDNNATFTALRGHFPANKKYELLHRVPFSSERKWSAAVLKGFGTIVLGAPEKVLRNNGESLPQEAREAQSAGKRILCLAYCPDEQPFEDLPKLKLISAIEINDVIRKDAKETLAFFKSEGVQVKVISGDNPETVSSIARQAGLEDYESCIDLSAIHSDEEVMAAATQYSVFGRVTPGQKSLLVKALKEAGHTVAMTGDGVNDVLALREADCSIAMAAGSDATRQISKMVLLDSDFTAIPDIVMEGRRVVNNITRLGGVFLVKTFYSVMLSVYLIMTAGAFPFVPLQITLYDFGIEAFPSFLLSFEPDKSRLRGKFLPNVLSRCLPFSVTVVSCVVALKYIGPSFGLTTPEIATAKYYITSLIGLAALFVACLPLNHMRVAIWALSVAAFFVPVMIFGSFPDLSLTALPGVAKILVGVMAAISIPLILLLRHVIGKLIKLWINYKKPLKA